MYCQIFLDPYLPPEACRCNQILIAEEVNRTDPAWLEHVADELRMINVTLHDAEGAAIRERHAREVA